MDYDAAESVIENVAGFTERDTPVGEAWEVVQARIAALESELAEARAIVDRFIAVRHEYKSVSEYMCDHPGNEHWQAKFMEAYRAAESARTEQNSEQGD